MTKRFASVVVLAASLLADSATAQVDPDARQVLDASAVAMRAPGCVAFHSRTMGNGPLKDVIDMSGEVKVWRPEGVDAVLWRVEGRGKQLGWPDGERIVAVWDGRVLRWSDNRTGEVQEGEPSRARAKEVWSWCRELLTAEWLDPGVFDSEVGRYPALHKVGVVTLDGERCDVVRASSPKVYRQWAVGANDHLLRSFTVGTEPGPNDIAKATELTGLRAAPLEAADLRVEPLPVEGAPVAEKPRRSPARSAQPAAPKPAPPNDGSIAWMWNRLGEAWGTTARGAAVGLVLLCGVLAVVHGRRWFRR